MSALISWLGRIIAWIITLVLAIGAGAGVFLYLVFQFYGFEAHETSQNAVCQILRLAQGMSLVTAEQRAQWAKVATPAEELRGGREYAAYYMSDCSMTTLAFEIKRQKQ